MQSFPLFLVSVVLISLSGVMMPGPVFAVSLAHGRKNKNAGALVTLGHSLIELPIMMIIFIGFGKILSNLTLRSIIGLVGGLILIYMGIEFFKVRKLESNSKFCGSNPIVSGFITSASNPYFFLWWASVGAALIASALAYGIIGFIIFAVVHLSCDLVWLLFVSRAGYYSKRIENRIIPIICGGILVVFGFYFIISGIRILI